MAIKTITFATTDYAIKQNKKHRYLYIVINTNDSFTVTLTTDRNTSISYNVNTGNNGYQLIKLPLRNDQVGTYWTISISSSYDFSLEKVSVIYYPVRRR
jgi:hypothetical protein